MIWILIDHPQQLMTALGLVQKYNIGKSDVSLLISNHPYHKNIKVKYEKYFNDVIIFKRVNLGRNIIKDTINFFKQDRQVKKIIKEKFKSDDILVGLSTCQVLENMFLSFSQIKKVAIVTESQYNYAYRELENYQQYPRMMIYKGIINILGLYDVFNGLLKGYRKKIKDGIDILRYIKPVHKIYDEVFYMVNVDNTTNKYLEKYKNTHKLSYLSFKDDCKEANKKEVVFIGNCFLSFDNFPSSRYAENTNKFLEYIRTFYKDKNFIYIPHPKEQNETKMLNMNDFEVYNGNLNAELYFQKNYCNIEACFSIASTVTRNALAYNIQSYSFLKVMGFEKQQEEYYTNLYGNIQDEVYIESLEEMPQRIEFQSINSEKLQEVLGL